MILDSIFTAENFEYTNIVFLLFWTGKIIEQITILSKIDSKTKN